MVMQEIVTITLTREQAVHLSRVLQAAHTHGIYDFDGVRALRNGRNPTPLFHEDERLRAAWRALRKLEDRRRKGIDLSPSN